MARGNRCGGDCEAAIESRQDWSVEKLGGLPAVRPKLAKQRLQSVVGCSPPAGINVSTDRKWRRASFGRSSCDRARIVRMRKVGCSEIRGNGSSNAIR